MPVSSENGVRSDASGRLQLAAGEQALVAVPAIRSSLRYLPPDATDNALLVSSESPGDVEESLEGMGAHPSNVGMIPVSGSRVEYDGPLHVAERVVPDDLTGLSMQVSTAIDALVPGRGWIVFDRLNVFLLYADERRVLRFLDHVAATARDANLRGLFCVVPDAIDARTYEKVKQRVDREIDVH